MNSDIALILRACNVMVNFDVSTGHCRQAYEEEEETTPYLARA